MLDESQHVLPRLRREHHEGVLRSRQALQVLGLADGGPDRRDAEPGEITTVSVILGWPGT